MSEQEINPKEFPRGFTRREFCKFSAAIVAALGINLPLLGCSDNDCTGEDPEKLLRDYLENVADHFNSNPSELMGTQGWINARIGFKTDDLSDIQKALLIEDGKLDGDLMKYPPNADATVVFFTKECPKRVIYRNRR